MSSCASNSKKPWKVYKQQCNSKRVLLEHHSSPQTSMKPQHLYTLHPFVVSLSIYLASLVLLKRAILTTQDAVILIKEGSPRFPQVSRKSKELHILCHLVADLSMYLATLVSLRTYANWEGYIKLNRNDLSRFSQMFIDIYEHLGGYKTCAYYAILQQILVHVQPLQHH